MKIAGKGNNLCAGVEHDAADPAFAGDSFQSLQATHVTAA